MTHEVECEIEWKYKRINRFVNLRNALKLRSKIVMVVDDTI